MTPSGFPVSIAPLAEAAADAWVNANTTTRGDSELRRLSAMWNESREGKRVILAAWNADAFVGHVTMKWQSEYDGFRRRHLPEIVDLWVQPECRRRGVARRLMDAVEARARLGRAKGLGLCVGVDEDAKPAQALYARLGFRPDGSGLWRDGAPVDMKKDGVSIDTDVVWMWVKTL